MSGRRCIVLLGLFAATATAADEVALQSKMVTVTGPTLSTVTNVIPSPGEPASSIVRAKIALAVTNTSDRALWVAVKLTPPAPEPDCPRGVGYVERGASMEFRCTPERVVAGRDYALQVTTFSDSSLTDTLGTASTRLRFAQDEVDMLDLRLAERRREIESNGAAELEQSAGDRGYDFVLSLSGGLVDPVGDFADGFDLGGMGTASAGILGRQFGVRLLSGSTEPGTRGVTNDAWTARLGAPVHVNEAIVPIELQGTMALPSRDSRYALSLLAGAGLHFTTVRIEHTDERLEEDTLFGFSAGGGFRYFARPRNAKALSVGLNGVYHGTGSRRYTTVELEIGFLW